MKIRFTGEVDIPLSEPGDAQLVRDCAVSALWSQLNDGGLTEPIIERLKLKLEVIQEVRDS